MKEFCRNDSFSRFSSVTGLLCKCACLLTHLATYYSVFVVVVIGLHFGKIFDHPQKHVFTHLKEMRTREKETYFLSIRLPSRKICSRLVLLEASKGFSFFSFFFLKKKNKNHSNSFV